MGLGLRLKIAVNTALRKAGYQITRFQPEIDAQSVLPDDFDETDRQLWEAVFPHTMTSPERIYSLRRAVEYIVESGVPGDIVESGVWKGGSSLAIALTLLRLGATDRHLYLYDTFDTGWPEAGEEDVTVTGKTAHELWLDELEAGQTPDTLFAKYEDVKALMESTGYPRDRIHISKGKVEDTIPSVAPAQVAMLRQDTDWYSSTRHELDHLYPRLSQGGVLIIDDYGFHMGAQKAADEYFTEHGIHLLLHRIDGSGHRIAIKCEGA